MGCDKIIKVGINGFGTVSSQVILNLLLQDNNNVELVAINDPSILIDDMATSLNYFCPGLQQHVFEVKNNENTLQFGQKSVTVHAIRNPEEIPWANSGVDLVVESTGLYTDLDKADAHLKAGAKKVIITDISKDAPMYVFGVNQKEYKPEHHIVSSASCITHQLAPIFEVLHTRFGILGGDMKILDSAIATQDVDGPSMTDSGDRRPAFFDLITKIASRANAAEKLLQALNHGFGIFAGLMPALNTFSTAMDVAKAVGKLLGIDDIDDLWTSLSKLLSTSAATNIIDGPRGVSSTGIIPADVEAVGKLLAYLYGKLTGTVSHGPTIGGSIVNLTVSLEKEATLEDIKAAIKEESKGRFKGILSYTEGVNVSRDLLGDRRSSIFDATPTVCSARNDNSFKFIFCCDNQWGYSCRVIDLIVHMASVQAPS